jgi:hypothetical protein
MGHSLGDALIVTAIAAAIVAYLYFRHLARHQRMEIIHQERLVAMEKGIPLPELPLDPVSVPKQQDPREILIHGIAWTALAGGAIVALLLVWPDANNIMLWPLPLPLLFLGVGLILYYALASNRAR